MQDPPVENIQGKKVHQFSHEINWGYVVLGLALIYTVSKISGWFEGKNQEPALNGGD